MLARKYAALAAVFLTPFALALFTPACGGVSESNGGTAGTGGTGGSADTTCAPESDTEFCARLGKTCDSFSGTDNCGSQRMASCGTCAEGTCGGSGTPNVCGSGPLPCGYGEIVAECSCGGTVHSSGYCCAGTWQSDACPPTQPMTAAHRTSGVAPLSVFFDAVDTTPEGPAAPFTWESGVEQPDDHEGTLYDWDFGDAGAGTWAQTGASRNHATGYTAAHVFETPGTYQVTLTVTTLNGEVRAYSQTIEVSPFTGTTYYVAADGDDAGDGTTESTPFLTIDHAMTTALDTAGPVRILFRRGDTFPITAAYPIEKPGPGIIGAYGSGDRPVLQVPDLGEENVFSPRGDGKDWRIMDLDMVGPSTSTNTGPVGPDVSHQGVDTLILRIKARTWHVGIGWGDWEPIWETPHDGMFVVESEVLPTGNCSMYVGGRRLALLGNLAYDGLATHITRVWQAHKGVISNNAFLRPGGQRHAIKLHGAEINTTRPETRWVTITDNRFEASVTSQWTVSMGSQSGAPDEADFVSHVVLERNRFTGSPSLTADIESEAHHVMIRNNLLDDTLSPAATAVLYGQRNELLPVPDDIRIYNNTVYKGSAAGTEMSVFDIGPEVTDCRVRNNLVGVASTNSITLLTGGGGDGWAEDHNLLTAEPAFTSPDTGDFSLMLGSPAIDAGVTLPETGVDFLGVKRPVGAAYDLGAHESH